MAMMARRNKKAVRQPCGFCDTVNAILARAKDMTKKAAEEIARLVHGKPEKEQLIVDELRKRGEL